MPFFIAYPSHSQTFNAEIDNLKLFDFPIGNFVFVGKILKMEVILNMMECEVQKKWTIKLLKNLELK